MCMEMSKNVKFSLVPVSKVNDGDSKHILNPEFLFHGRLLLYEFTKLEL